MGDAAAKTRSRLVRSSSPNGAVWGRRAVADMDRNIRLRPFQVNEIVLFKGRLCAETSNSFFDTEEKNTLLILDPTSSERRRTTPVRSIYETAEGWLPSNGRSAG